MKNIFTQHKPASYRSFLKCSLLATASLLAIFAAQPSTAQSQTQIAVGQSILPSSSAALGQNKSPDSGKPKISFSIAPGGLYFFYREYEQLYQQVEEPPLMDITGAMGGFESTLKINFNPNGVGVLVIPFDIGFYAGTRMRYTGQESTTEKKGTYGSAVTNFDNMLVFWTRSLIGPSIAFLDHYRINVLSGVGYKYTKNTTSNYENVLRTNDLVYLPVALQFQYSKDIFSVLTHVEYDVFLSGWQTSSNRGTPSPTDNQSVPELTLTHTTQKQLQGHGARVFVELNVANFTITPFFNFFWIQTSQYGTALRIGEITGRVYGFTPETAEPVNITTESGVKFGYQF